MQRALSWLFRTLGHLVVEQSFRWMLGIAVLGLLLQLAATFVLAIVGLDLQDGFVRLAVALGVDGAWPRLVVFGAAQGLVWWLAGDGLQRLGERWDRAKRAADRWLRERLGASHRALRRLQTRVFRVVYLALFTALVVQPTLVPWSASTTAWVQRAANLIDGTAVAAWVDSAMGLVHKVAPAPITPGAPVDPSGYSAPLTARSLPMMDRWDEALLAAADGDAELAALTKAVMWVESRGRQYAISPTGCAGLMQFCASTARSRPFRGIFGIGQVAPCGCRDCSMSQATSKALETDPTAVERLKREVPCDLSDARFDGEKSVRAGTAYMRQLIAQVGDNPLLVYVGYNSGPAIAQQLYDTLGQPSSVTVADLRPHLQPALAPYYGAASTRRAQGLLNSTLPELQRALDRFSP
ncbi:MAG: lytic transglycosylase domain-containing protein [Myxococcales bacterium]|nr:lytic transglycosylase domain-containing protein [Myxococcales bacterium]